MNKEYKRRGNDDRRERRTDSEPKRFERNGNRIDSRPEGERRSFGRSDESGNHRSYNRGQGGTDRREGEKRNFDNNRQQNFSREGRNGGNDNRRFGEERRDSRGGNEYGEQRHYRSREEGSRDFNRDNRFESSERGGQRESRGYRENRDGNFNRDRQYSSDRGNNERPRREGQEPSRRIIERSRDGGEGRKIFRKTYNDGQRPEISKADRHELQQKHYSKKKILAHRLKNEGENAELRLNRYISMGGVCSRRDADELIKSGRVKVNGEVVLTVGVKVHKKDRIEVDDAVITPERKVYLILNKPKDYVTTVEDPLERRTVMSLVEGACKERVYPVGRLDRQTTGVLLFTNDGDLAKKLTHPKYDHKKIYHVFLDKPLAEENRQAIENGMELEDGFIKADEIRYASDDKTEVGIEIHSGRNRVVRRIFEHFGYQIVKLDRVYFAGITKKNVPRGKWRFLTQAEVDILKFY